RCVEETAYSVSNNTATYTLVGGSVNGCDSIVTLDLTIKSAATGTDRIESCVPITWIDGNIYSTSNNTATYTLVGGSVNGCDSIVTLDLTINSAVSSTTNVAICKYQLPYLWNGQSINTAGTFTETLIASNGCDSIATLNLTISPTKRGTESIDICSKQLPYSWNGQLITAAGNHTANLLSTDGCDSIVSLTLKVKPNSASMTDALVCASQLPYSWNGNNYTNGGSYKVTLTNYVGCDSIATLNLIVTPLPNAGEDGRLTICESDINSINLFDIITGEDPGGIWERTSGSGGKFNPATGLFVPEIGVTNSTFNYVVAGKVPCENDFSVATIEVNTEPNAGTFVDPKVCSGGNVEFILSGDANSEITYNINGGANSITILNNGNTKITLTNVTVKQTINLISIKKGVCIVPLNKSTEVNVVPSPPAPDVITPVKYCVNQKADPLLVSAENPLKWYTVPLGGSSSSVTPIPPTSNAGTLNYYVSQTDGNCEGPRSLITVNINRNPTLGRDISVKLCYGDSTNLLNLYETDGLTTYWYTNGGPVLNPEVVKVPGSYNLVATNASGCTDTASVIVNVLQQLIANAGEDAVAEYGMQYLLDGSKSSGGEFQWSPGEPLLNNARISNPAATLTENTQFVLKIYNELGCYDLDSVNIKVLKGPTFYMPNAFTPNGDGLNDVFRPTAVGIDKIRYFRIYNRYGNLLFETTQIGKGWDGTYKGVRQNAGNYVWVLEGTDRFGETKVLKGNAILIR
ncbi:MAG: gliding motility-associated C-terminal domain-containing protein, partial [Ferruginibacter sp.]|nr:gliding motility-associated C-terminal domain-containing protein [Ferruginibacter sp.]